MTELRPAFSVQEPDVAEVTPERQGGWLRRSAGRLCRWLLIIAAIVAGMWATLAVYYTDLPAGAAPRTIAAILFGGVCLVLPILVRSWKLSVAAVGVMFAVVLTWFLTRPALQDRNWTPDVAQTPIVSIDGDRLTIQNFRNFDYRSETDFTPRWETRNFDLSKLRTVDYILSHWGSDAIAHVILSFGFSDGKYLAVSIETRKEQGESYSAVQGFFRQYELIYVFADERDVLRLRTNFRNEDVYMFRLRGTPAQVRGLLESYARRANALAAAPEFYNALTSNCSTNVTYHMNAGARTTISPWHLSLVLNGYSARLAYDAGATDRSVPYEDLRKMCRINPTAADAAPDELFSHRLRVGLPDPTLVK